eukprot:3051206-Rhodomonas_salina.2
MTERKVPNGHTQPVTCAIYNPTFELVVSADESSLVPPDALPQSIPESDIADLATRCACGI